MDIMYTLSYIHIYIFLIHAYIHTYIYKYVSSSCFLNVFSFGRVVHGERSANLAKSYKLDGLT